MDDLRDELRAHPYITTFTGARFSYESPGPFRIADVARSLSLTARFRGHTRFLYSVAQHSLMVFEMARRDGCGTMTRAAALLHDAHEAYVGDVPTPLKWACPEMVAVERRIAAALRASMLPDVPSGCYDVVKDYDTAALHIEAAALLDPIPDWVNTKIVGLGIGLLNDRPEDVERRFLDRAAELGLV